MKSQLREETEPTKDFLSHNLFCPLAQVSSPESFWVQNLQEALWSQVEANSRTHKEAIFMGSFQLWMFYDSMKLPLQKEKLTCQKTAFSLISWSNDIVSVYINILPLPSA